MIQETPVQKEQERLDEKLYALLFGVRRSIRYHNRRRMFFDRFNLITKALSVVFGSATIYTVLSQTSPKATIGAAAIVTLFSALDLVVGTVRMARLHDDLARRFIALEKEIVQTIHPTEENLARFTAQRLDIEADEPPVYRVLDALCHNELARAEGHPQEEFAKIRLYQRWFAQFFDIGEHRIHKYGQS